MRIGLLICAIVGITSVVVACILIYAKSEQVKQNITDKASVAFAILFVIEFVIISILVLLLTFKLNQKRNLV